MLGPANDKQGSAGDRETFGAGAAGQSAGDSAGAFGPRTSEPAGTAGRGDASVRPPGDDCTPGILVRPLTPALLDDWLSYFDHDAFADNPDWSGCYCYFFHVDRSLKDWNLRTAAENRAASIELIQAGVLRGYLAYADGRPAGWCQAAPRLSIPNVTNDPDLAVPDEEQVGSIVCFNVSHTFRKRGIASRLLGAALAGFHSEGLRIAEAYPRPRAEGDAANYHGPLELYLRAGFRPYRETGDVVIVRREVRE